MAKLTKKALLRKVAELMLDASADIADGVKAQDHARIDLAMGRKEGYQHIANAFGIDLATRIREMSAIRFEREYVQMPSDPVGEAKAKGHSQDGL